MKWKMVPVEPSTDSRWAGAKKKNAYRLVGGRKANPYEIYQAMLEAAPKYEPTDEQVERAARALATADGKDPDEPAWIRYPGGHTSGICWRDQYADKARAVLMTLGRG